MLTKKILMRWFTLASWKQIVCALFLGIATGLLLQKKALFLEPIGIMFIHAIQMLVAPVVTTAVVCAILSLQDFSRMGRIFLKAIILYLLGMMVSATIGISIANLFKVGYGFSLASHEITTTVVQMPHFTLRDTLINIVPTSSIAAFANNNVMQILCFSILFGIALKLTGEKAKPVQAIFYSLSEVVFKFARIIISFAPYGIFALVACMFGQYGLTVLVPLVKFVGAVYLSCFLVIIFFYGTVLLLNRISPLWFLGHIITPLATAFTTSSSAATLPITMRCAVKSLRIKSELADFLLPLGTTLNLNGLAIYLGVAAIFAAHLFGIHLDIHQYVYLVVVIAFTASGAAAIPGSALVIMSAVMNSVGIPLGALPLIAGVDRFNDMAQTTTNVAGDLFAALLVAKSEHMMDKD